MAQTQNGAAGNEMLPCLPAGDTLNSAAAGQPPANLQGQNAASRRGDSILQRRSASVISVKMSTSQEAPCGSHTHTHMHTRAAPQTSAHRALPLQIHTHMHTAHTTIINADTHNLSCMWENVLTP